MPAEFRCKSANCFVNVSNYVKTVSNIKSNLPWLLLSQRLSIGALRMEPALRVLMVDDSAEDAEFMAGTLSGARMSVQWQRASTQSEN